jgi:hypothetical protein
MHMFYVYVVKTLFIYTTPPHKGGGRNGEITPLCDIEPCQHNVYNEMLYVGAMMGWGRMVSETRLSIEAVGYASRCHASR